MSDLVVLAQLISDSVVTVTDEYAKAGYAPPTLQSTEQDPFQSPKLVSQRLNTAIKTIEAACAQLSATVASPGHVVTNKAYGFVEPACMRVVMDATIPDLLFGRTEGVHVDELGQLSKQDPGKLARILRTLATNHVFTEVTPNVFANNRLSVKLISTDAVASLAGIMSDEIMKAGAFLGDVFEDPVTRKSDTPDNAAFQRAHGVTPFNYYGDSERPKIFKRFSQAMVGWGEVTGRAMLPNVYCWDTLPPLSTVVDVGGGNGHATLALLKAFPTLKIIVQDTPSVLVQGRQYWREEYPKALEERTIDFVAIDFMTEAPVANCAVYYLRHVLHDWPDDDCVKILKNIRKSTNTTSRLLINEFVPQYIVRGGVASNTQAPAPLLPNYGAGNKRLYQQDMNMMIQFNSKERTLDEFVALGQTSGFTFVKLWDGGEAGIVEFVPS